MAVELQASTTRLPWRPPSLVALATHPSPASLHARQRGRDKSARRPTANEGGAASGRRESLPGRGDQALAYFARDLDEGEHVLLGRAEVHEAGAQVHLAVDERGGDVDSTVLEERLRERPVVLVQVSGSLRHVAERHDRELRRRTEHLEVGLDLHRFV